MNHNNYYYEDATTSLHGCQRSDERHPVLHSQEAFVEFADPENRQWKLDLLGISTGGVCFGLENGQPLLDRGSRLAGTVLRIGDVAINGTLTIAHTTSEFGSGTLCGAQFQPATEMEERQLKEAIARLGW